MTPPRCAFGAPPQGGSPQRPGEAGSAAATCLPRIHFCQVPSGPPEN